MSKLKTKKQTNIPKNKDKYINTFVRGPKPTLKKDSAQINEEEAQLKKKPGLS